MSGQDALAALRRKFSPRQQLPARTDRQPSSTTAKPTSKAKRSIVEGSTEIEGIVLREDEDGSRLQRIDSRGHVANEISLKQLSGGRGPWFELRRAAEAKQLEAIEDLEKGAALSDDEVTNETLQNAREQILSDGRTKGYRPHLELHRKARQRFRDLVWRSLFPEIDAEPSELLRNCGEGSICQPAFRVAIWRAEQPDLARHLETQVARRSRRQTAEQDEQRQEWEEDGRVTRGARA